MNYDIAIVVSPLKIKSLLTYSSDLELELGSFCLLLFKDSFCIGIVIRKNINDAKVITRDIFKVFGFKLEKKFIEIILEVSRYNFFSIKQIIEKILMIEFDNLFDYFVGGNKKNINDFVENDIDNIKIEIKPSFSSVLPLCFKSCGKNVDAYGIVALEEKQVNDKFDEIIRIIKSNHLSNILVYFYSTNSMKQFKQYLNENNIKVQILNTKIYKQIHNNNRQYIGVVATTFNKMYSGQLKDWKIILNSTYFNDCVNNYIDNKLNYQMSTFIKKLYIEENQMYFYDKKNCESIDIFNIGKLEETGIEVIFLSKELKIYNQSSNMCLYNSINRKAITNFEKNIEKKLVIDFYNIVNIDLYNLNNIYINLAFLKTSDLMNVSFIKSQIFKILSYIKFNSNEKLKINVYDPNKILNSNSDLRSINEYLISVSHYDKNKINDFFNSVYTTLKFLCIEGLKISEQSEKKSKFKKLYTLQMKISIINDNNYIKLVNIIGEIKKINDNFFDITLKKINTPFV